MTEFDPSVALQTSERLSPRLTTEYLENHAVMSKLPAEHKFLDLSDYGRAPARWIANSRCGRREL